MNLAILSKHLIVKISSFKILLYSTKVKIKASDEIVKLKPSLKRLENVGSSKNFQNLPKPKVIENLRLHRESFESGLPTSKNKHVGSIVL